MKESPRRAYVRCVQTSYVSVLARTLRNRPHHTTPLCMILPNDGYKPSTSNDSPAFGILQVPESRRYQCPYARARPILLWLPVIQLFCITSATPSSTGFFAGPADRGSIMQVCRQWMGPSGRQASAVRIGMGVGRARGCRGGGRARGWRGVERDVCLANPWGAAEQRTHTPPRHLANSVRGAYQRGPCTTAQRGTCPLESPDGSPPHTCC